MRYRKFGKTDLLVSETGFGAWAIGGAAQVGNISIGWGETDDAVSAEAIHAALDAGINFFDTADFYGLGHSEQLLGEILGNRNDVILATKAGQRKEADRIVIDNSRQYILSACEHSLRRLKRDSIDYYQLHVARLVHLQQGECIEAMELLKQQGKIRYWGLSLNTFYPAPEADWMMEHHKGDGFQLVYNLINQRALSIINEASSRGYGIIARMPLQFGLLTGKFSSATVFNEDDHRRFRLTGEILERSIRILEEKVWPLAAKLQMNKTAFALSFILSHPGIHTVIPGIRTKEQVLANTAGIQQLDSNTLVLLQSLSVTDWALLLKLMEKQG